MAPVRTVLVIEDIAAVRETLKQFLTADGYRVALAENGQAGLTLLQRPPLPDLILLDLMMPVMTGFEVLASLRLQPHWASIPVIVLTATPGHTAVDLKVDALLKKPFNEADVKAAILLASSARAKH
jgi:two-component system chemotaxis response regulator CheY